MTRNDYRAALEAYIQAEAMPPDKFIHQPRLYALSCRLAESEPFDDDVLYAGAWLHDLGVFVGHRPEDLAKLAVWDHVAYAMEKTPALLDRFGFPRHKITAVVEIIRTHLPSREPTRFEGVLLRDADMLEQLGAVGILRTVSKVGRDTRFVTYDDALRVLRRNLEQYPPLLKLDSSRRAAQPRIEFLRIFLAAEHTEGGR